MKAFSVTSARGFVDARILAGYSEKEWGIAMESA
jgi:hypothetical protein